MKTSSRRLPAALAAVLSLIVTLALGAIPTAAIAAESGLGATDIGWYITESTGGRPMPGSTPPQTNSEFPRPSAAGINGRSMLAPIPGEDALRQECRNQHADQASTQEGWMKDRFNRCFIGHRLVQLRCKGCTITIASVEFDYTLLGMAQDGTRQVDFVLTFDDWTALGGQERETTPMRLSIDGCGGFVSCDPTGGELTQPLLSWQNSRRFQVTMTSANNTGIGEEFIAHAQSALNMAILPQLPDIEPWTENGMTRADVRFDSAGARAGKHHGTVFYDFTPTFDLYRLALAANAVDEVREATQHIEDALYRPVRTFPSFVSKSIPGRYRSDLGANQRPLHRLVNKNDQDLNRANAKKICVDVWGDGAATPDLNCDEYPFASTKEGAYTGSTVSTGNPEGWRTWNGSARLIGEVDNQDAGRSFLNNGFYQVNRILNGDPFFVDVKR